jgi:hypothetical protein
MSDPGSSEKSFEELQQMANEAIVTRSQALNTLRRLAELLIEEGHLVRGAGVLRSLQILTGEPYRPKSAERADVVPLSKPPFD